MSLINDMPPNNDFTVGVYRTLNEVFTKDKTDTENGIIFREDSNIMVSVKGTMMVIELDTKAKEFKFKGMPLYKMPEDPKSVNDIIINTVMPIKNNTNGSLPSDIQSAAQGIIDNSKASNSSWNNGAEAQQPVTVQQAPGAQQPPYTPQQNTNTDVDASEVEQYSEALSKANLKIDDLVSKVAKDTTIPKENVDKLKTIKHLLKDAYTDGNQYVFISTVATDGSITTGIIDKGLVRFTKEDWNKQSEEMKAFRD